MKKIKAILLMIMITAAVIISITCLLMSTNWAQNYVTTKITKYLSENLSCTVKLENLKFSFPFSIKINSLNIGKESQEWIRSKDVIIKANLFALLKKKISFEQISAEQIILTHAPQFVATSNNDIEGNNIPKFLAKINIKNFSIKEFIIKPTITNLDTDVVFAFDSNMKYSSGILQVYLKADINQSFNKATQGITVSSEIKFNTQDKILDIEQMKIYSPLYDSNFMGYIDFKTEKLTADYKIFCTNLNLINSSTNGRLSIEGKVKGDLKNIHLGSTVATENVKYTNIHLPDVLLSSEAHFDLVKQVGKIDINEESKDIATEISFAKKFNIIEIDYLKVKKDSTSFSGKLDFDLDNLLLNGKLKLTSTDFSDLLYTSDLVVNGQGEILLNFKPEGKYQKLEAELQLSNLIFDKLGIISVKSKLIIPDILGLQLQSFDLSIEDIHYKQELINKKINFQIIPDNKDFKLNLKSQGQPYNNFDSQILGNIKQDINKKIILTIDNLSTKFNKHIIAINKPAIVEIKDSNFQYQLPELLIDNGVLTSVGSLVDKIINMKATIKKLPLYIRELNLPPAFLKAYIESELKVNGNLANPEISAKLKVNDILLPSGKNLSINLDSAYINKRIDLSLYTKNDPSINSNLKLSVPTEISIVPYKFAIKETEKINGNVNIKSQLDALASLFLPPIHRLKGQFNVSANITGSIQIPYINGLTDISNGKYENVELGIKIKNIKSIIEAQGRKILLKELRIYEDKKLAFTGNGYFNLDMKNLPFNFDFKANNFYFLNHPNVQSAIDADIQITGSNKNINVTGDIKPKSLEIRLPEQFEKEIYELNVTKIINNKGAKPIVNDKSFFDDHQVNIDVKILANNRVFVKGWGLDAELGGKLKCQGTLKHPIVKGSLETMHGRYQEFGKQFMIKEGSLIFSGSIPPSPFLNITASSEQDNIEVMIVISGPLLNPKLSIESNPPLPQDEALSLLLFGKQSSQITPFQAIQLADSIRRFSGHGSSINMLDKARGVLKIDEIRLKNNPTTNDTALGIGKYINDKVFIEVEKGVQEGSGKTRIEVEIKNHLTFESSIGESGGSIGANWKVDY
ncbi:MAG: hypothetical protein EOP33_01810 [Rickettsiaceae bacterium]|nr:MAG: hypothetical protein EOP33_01810 [Rickettsiaceae bacterium]